MTKFVGGGPYLHWAKHHSIGRIERAHADNGVLLTCSLGRKSWSVVTETIGESQHQLQIATILDAEEVAKPFIQVEWGRQTFAGTDAFLVYSTLGLEEFIELRLCGELRRWCMNQFLS